MSPSWYDLLDVEPDATTEEIRAAWVASIAGLDPTDRQFRSRSRAAEVLLDPDRRAAYDADLAAHDVDNTSEEDEGQVSEETTRPRARPTIADGLAKASEGGSDSADVGTGSTEAERDITRGAPASDPEAARSPSRRAAIGTAVTAGLALVLAIVTVLAWIEGGETEDSSLEPRGPGIGRFLLSLVPGGADGAPDAQAVRSAESAAVAAIVPILSYDYRTLDADAEAATSYMTPRFAAEYDQYFAAAVQTNAPSTRTIVTNEVVDSGIARTGPGRVDVLLFVNQLSVNRQTGPDNPKVLRNGVTARMVEQDGDWLVECLITTLGGSCGDEDDPAPTTSE